MASADSMTVASQPPCSVVQLARRWVVDYFNRHDASAAREFVAPDYALRIGEYTFAGRDAQWLPAVQKQMDLFPGLGMTVHQVLAGTDQVAVWFSQHGVAAGGRVACWSGVAIYQSNGQQLTGCVAQEDYMTRQRQLKSGVGDPLDAPTPAPWDTVPLPPDLQAEAVVRQWLSQSWPLADAAVRCDDEYLTGLALDFQVQASDITVLFSSGADVAFHARQNGLYRGGLAGLPASSLPAVLHVNGIVRVQDGRVCGGRVIRDRAGVRAALLQAGAP